MDVQIQSVTIDWCISCFYTRRAHPHMHKRNLHFLLVPLPKTKRALKHQGSLWALSWFLFHFELIVFKCLANDENCYMCVRVSPMCLQLNAFIATATMFYDRERKNTTDGKLIAENTVLSMSVCYYLVVKLSCFGCNWKVRASFPNSDHLL